LRRTYHIFAITDSEDSYSATLKFIKNLYMETKDLLEEIDKLDVPVIEQKVERVFSERVEKLLKKMVRPLRSWRAGGWKSVLLAALVTYMLSVFLYTFIYSVINVPEIFVLQSMIIVGISTTLGIVGGMIAGVPKEGSIGSWLGHFISIIPVSVDTLLHEGFLNFIGFLLLGGIVTGSYVAALGFLFGLLYDNNFLR